MQREVIGTNGALIIYIDDVVVAGAGEGGYGGWSWWARATRGRRVYVATMEDAYTQARLAAR